MRLLNTSTRQVEEFLGTEIPEYVILSRTWGEEEVSLQCCEKAASDGFLYCWIDTCCIDKTSSAELSEAINSMYKWYHNSRICYAYLADVEPSSKSVIENYRSFPQSRWWTRGWTLQELLAPSVVEFYSANWVELGTKFSLHEQITEITGIDEGVLSGASPLRRRNVAVRMSWASRRKTSRIEDEAYCLMGLFEVNVPLLYGEGNRAFIRLQEEIMRVREDYTLFTWCPIPKHVSSNSPGYKGLLANSPSDFIESEDRLTPWNSVWNFRALERDCSALPGMPQMHDPPSLTSRGLRISLPVFQENDSGELYACLTLLHAHEKEEFMLCAKLHRLSPSRLSPKSDRYIRRVAFDLELIPMASAKGFKYKSVYIVRLSPDPFRYLSRPDSVPSLIIFKPNISRDQRLACYFSSEISMSHLLSARFPADATTESMSGHNINKATESSNGNNKGENLHRHRLNKLINALITLDRQDTICLAMKNPAELCWFSYFDSAHSTDRSSGRIVLGFRNERHPRGAFLVQLGLFVERPVCNVVLVAFEDPRNEECQKRWLEEAQRVILKKDRATLHLRTKSEEGEEKGNDMEITVSVRRVASAALVIRRIVLEMALKSVPIVLEMN